MCPAVEEQNRADIGFLPVLVVSNRAITSINTRMGATAFSAPTNKYLTDQQLPPRVLRSMPEESQNKADQDLFYQAAMSQTPE